MSSYQRLEVDRTSNVCSTRYAFRSRSRPGSFSPIFDLNKNEKVITCVKIIVLKTGILIAVLLYKILQDILQLRMFGTSKLLYT